MRPRSTRKKLLILIAVPTAALLIGLIFYSILLTYEIEKRFSGRRWRIPSRVFSDTTLIYPGQHFNLDLFEEKLDRLRYRQVPHQPSRKGELRKTATGFDIFLHDFETASGKREGYPVRIELEKNRIRSILRAGENADIPLLELEPEEIMVFFGTQRERRRLISIREAPRHLVHAVLAAEDSRFYSHSGLDPRGIARAIYTNFRRGTIRQGGSTITQQLAKNYFLTPERTFSRKAKELLMSLIIEWIYGKDEILEIYLNEIYFGQKGPESVHGIGEAAFFYFGKPVGELTIAESAAIAGLIRAPNTYSPYADRERSRSRRDHVLESMHKNEWISRDEFDAALKSPVDPAGYKHFGRRAPYFSDYLFRQLSELYSSEVLSSLGFSIFTTLDTQVQSAAEKGLERGLAALEKKNRNLAGKEPGKRLQGAVLVIQPKTGYILAMAGGRDYERSQFNRITQSKRQPGSAFKPFVFLAGLDAFTPASKLMNEPKTYEMDGKTWEPQNYAPVKEKSFTMRSALAASVNRAAVDLAMKVGIDEVIRTASRFQFSTSLHPYPSIALGSSEVVPLELARAYCAFAADGLLPHPMSLKDVVDENGKILERRHMGIERATSPEKAFLMTSMLKSAVDNGTASALKGMGITFPVAGKTGTTNDFKDAWFIGYNPDILVLVWVGFDNGDSIQASGAAASLPIWADLMKSIPQHISGEWFEMPPGVVERTVCGESGKLAVPQACRIYETEFFLDGTPQEPCNLHVPVDRPTQLKRYGNTFDHVQEHFK